MVIRYGSTTLMLCNSIAASTIGRIRAKAEKIIKFLIKPLSKSNCLVIQVGHFVPRLLTCACRGTDLAV